MNLKIHCCFQKTKRVHRESDEDGPCLAFSLTAVAIHIHLAIFAESDDESHLKLKRKPAAKDGNALLNQANMPALRLDHLNVSMNKLFPFERRLYLHCKM